MTEEDEENYIEYEFICGKKKKIPEKKLKWLSNFGAFEICGHECPEDRDPTTCELFAKNTHYPINFLEELDDDENEWWESESEYYRL